MGEDKKPGTPEAFESFDSPNVVGDGLLLKGKVSGITKLSKKTKIVVISAAAVIIGLIFVSIMSIEDAPQDGERRTKEAEDQKGGVYETDPPPADAMRYDGGIVMPSADYGDEVETVTPPGEPPALPAKDGESVLVAQENGPVVPDLSNTVEARGGALAEAPQPTPEEVAALQLKQLRAQKLAEAMNADVGVLKDSSGRGQGGVGPLGTIGPGMGNLQAPNGYSPGAPSGGQQQDDQNKQLRKERFLKDAAAQADTAYLKEVLRPELSPYEVKADSIIPAVLISSINSDLPGQIKAMVSETIYDTKTGRYPLIPQGAKLIGEYDSQVAFGQSRLLVVWTRVIFPNGASMALHGMPAGDAAGAAGLSGEVNNHYWRTFISAGLLSVITAAAQLSQPAQQATTGGAASAPTVAQTLTAGLGQQLGQAGTAIIQKQLNVQPTITNKPGSRFFVMVNRDMVFPGPYSAK